MRSRSTDLHDPIVQRLHALVKDSPDLKDVAELYEVMLPLIRDADLDVTPISIAPGKARGKMKAGLPLLHDLDLELDAEEVRDLALKLVTAIETIGRKSRWHGLRLPWPRASVGPDAATRLRLALEGGKVDVITLLPHVAGGENGPVISVAQSQQLDPDLLWTLAQNVLKPALRAWCRQLTPLVGEVPWLRDYCFVCGAHATLAELQENNQVKHLRCGQCGADWPLRRLACARCGNEDHRTLRHLYAEGRRDTMRLEVCERCHGYIKVIAAFTPTPPEMLQIEDLATLHLDYIARERGYERAPRKTPSGAMMA